MKQKLALLTAMLLLAATVSGCAETSSGSSSDAGASAPASSALESSEAASSESASSEPVAAESETQQSAVETKADPLPANNTVLGTPETVLERLKDGNARYVNNEENTADVTDTVRKDTYENGQHPYAVVVTCSDSRVPPEHIFSAGVGELFVIRTAGNVVDDFELGSIEYGAEHCGAKVVVVLGHESCGAVAAALDGHAEGNIASIVDEIKQGIGEETDASAAENLNITNTKNKIMESEIIRHLTESGELQVVEAKYNIETGEVEFLEN